MYTYVCKKRDTSSPWKWIIPNLSHSQQSLTGHRSYGFRWWDCSGATGGCRECKGFRWVYPSISGIDPKFIITMAVYMGETRISHGILVPTRMTHDVCCQRIKSSSAAVSFLLRYSADGCRFGTSKVSPLWVFWKVTHWQFATSLRTAETAHVLTGVRLLTIDFGR